MGDVFEAFDRDRGEVVALKTLTRADADTFARFKREFRALQSMVHPNLVSIGELICADDLWFFSMELVDGTHFQESVRGDVGGLRAALRQLVVGVHALHEGGLVHRDIKPSNVMITRDGRLVILDFGLVTHVDPKRQSYAQGPVGTVEYMAPEQATGRQVGEAADWYSVGVMLYEALTGTMPHHGHALQILVSKQQVEPTPPHELNPDVPRDLSDLCSELLAIEPASRPTATGIARRLGIDLVAAQRTSTPIVTPVFVGRERELAELARSAELARTQPRVHAVVGESGIGKSELVARFVRDLVNSDPNVVVFSGRCYERENVPYKAFDGIADGLAQDLASRPNKEVEPLLPPRPTLLVRLFPAFQRIEAIAAAGDRADEPGEPHEQRRRMFVAFRELIAAIARNQRVVLTIDDLQWADADSFLLLRELLRGTPALPVLILATVREADAPLSLLAGLPIERTFLGPLSTDECRALAEGIAPQKAAKLDLDRVSREAGGHPMFLQEIVRHLVLSGAGAAADTLDDALAARVALLRPEAQSLLEVVCIAGAPLPIDVAAQACRLDSTVSRSVASLRVAMLVRETQRGRKLTLEPYHDRVRESVANGIAKDRRREIHTRIAYALEAAPEPRDPQLLLRNFMLAELPQRAARYAEDAAQRSEAAHAFDQAAALWQTALDLVPRDPDDRRRLLLRLGEALIHAGRSADAAACYLSAAEGADRATRLECQRHAGEQLVIAGHIGPGMATLESLLAEIGVASPKTQRGSVASLLWTRARVRLRGLHFTERDRSEIADAEVLVLDVLKAAGTSLAMIDSIRGMDFTTRNLLQSLRIGHREHVARALLLESMFYATSSNPKRAQRLAERAIEVGGDPKDPYVGGMLAGARGAAAYFGGDPAPAVGHFAECIRLLAGAPGNNWERSTSRLFQLFSLRYVGDFVELRARYEDYLDDAAARGDVYLESTMRRACVSMFLAEDDVPGAIQELERATWGPPGDRYHVQHFHELVAWGELGLYSGTLDPRAKLDERFGRLHDSLLTRVTTIRIVDEFLRGRLAVAGHRPFAEAARAAKKLAAEKTPLPMVWARLLEAAIDPSPERFAIAAEMSAKSGLRAFAAASKWRVADLRGDAAGRNEAASTLVTLGVRDVERTVQLLAPVCRAS